MSSQIDALRAATAQGQHRRTGIDIPPSWTPAHLALRVREHYEFWKRSPGGMTGGKAGFWPAYVHTEKDIAGYINAEGVSDDVLARGNPYEDHLAARNRRIVPLNGYEVRIRDTIQDYLLAFRQENPVACEIIEFDGQKAAEGWSLRSRAQFWGCPKSTFADARKHALSLCCDSLNQRGKAVL
jgi:hypothetical protein